MLNLYSYYRRPEAEPIIMKVPGYAIQYARDILKERWVDAEPYIMKDHVVWDRYKKHFGIE
jgi:hypothetical protein